MIDVYTFREETSYSPTTASLQSSPMLFVKMGKILAGCCRSGGKSTLGAPLLLVGSRNPNDQFTVVYGIMSATSRRFLVMSTTPSPDEVYYLPSEAIVHACSLFRARRLMLESAVEHVERLTVFNRYRQVYQLDVTPRSIYQPDISFLYIQ